MRAKVATCEDDVRLRLSDFYHSSMRLNGDVLDDSLLCSATRFYVPLRDHIICSNALFSFLTPTSLQLPLRVLRRPMDSQLGSLAMDVLFAVLFAVMFEMAGAETTREGLVDERECWTKDI